MTNSLNSAWMRHLESVRWFGGKGAGAHLERRIPLPAYTPRDVAPSVRSEVAELAYPDGHTEYYHLLVAHYPEGSTPPGTVLGTDEVAGETVQVVDATTDPDALATFVAATEPAFADNGVRVWSGEQSNTTLVLGSTDLYKLFRRIEPGPNLDAEVLVALGGGSVPELRGRLLGAWPEGQSTDLGMVIERVAEATDGWELATAACVAGEDFTERARSLGAALRDVHMRLALSFGTDERPGDDVADVMVARLDAAVQAAPDLAPYAEGLRDAFEVLRGRTLTVQRVHGDFHLGQTLYSPRGWTIIDFEGEPAKTAAERREPDSVWRDVAGMVRSFDYVRSAHPDPSGAAATAWADEAREAFLTGYCGATSGDDVLGGYVIDKAVYEVVYERRNRPDWVDIPLRAIRAATPGASPHQTLTEKE
ncbi:MAG: phosphotransferase [Propionibacteriaceae bacterium]|nr:phosphotransferase [Propionibacteriaceae bacterium]